MAAPFSFVVPTSVRFGWNTANEITSALPEGTQRVAFLRGATGVAAASVRQALEDAGVTCVDVTCAGEPSIDSVNTALARLASQEVQAIVAVGGGSVIDTGKALSACLGHGFTISADFSDIPARLLTLESPVPCIAIPTTAGTGAEVTGNAVLEIPNQKAKVSLRGRALFPAAALVDPALLGSAPKATLLSAGLDAIVQTIEAYTSCKATPFTDALTAPNILPGLMALREILAGDPPDKAWTDMAWVSLTSGVALANGGLGAAHGIASVLGGRYDAPHGALCGRLLVPVLRKNREAAAPDTLAGQRITESMGKIAEAFPPLAAGDPLSGLRAWQDAQALPRLRHYGVCSEALDDLAAASAGASSSQKNAVRLSLADYKDILKEAL